MDENKGLIDNEQVPISPAVLPPPPSYAAATAPPYSYEQHHPGPHQDTDRSYQQQYPDWPYHQQGTGGPYQQQDPDWPYHQQGTGGPCQHQNTCSPPPPVTIVRHAQTPPKDYVGMSIMVTIFCCLGLPCGIVGIVKACWAKKMLASGQYEAALMYSQSAGRWSRAGLTCGCVFWCSYLIFFIVLIVNP